MCLRSLGFLIMFIRARDDPGRFSSETSAFVCLFRTILATGIRRAPHHPLMLPQGSTNTKAPTLSSVVAEVSSSFFRRSDRLLAVCKQWPTTWPHHRVTSQVVVSVGPFAKTSHKACDEPSIKKELSESSMKWPKLLCQTTWRCPTNAQ